MLTKNTTIQVIDDWQNVLAGSLVVGEVEDVSNNFESTLTIEQALVEAVAQEGSEIIVEISYGDDNWMKLTDLKGTAETPAVTTINDADVNAGEISLTLTDATTGDFDVVGRKWFIKDGTPANSESVRTQVNSVHTVTICKGLLRSHANGLSVYDRVDDFVVKIPLAASAVRVLYNNVDADSDVFVTSRILKVTDL